MNILDKKYRKFLRAHPNFGKMYAYKLSDIQAKVMKEDLTGLDVNSFKEKYRINKNQILLFGDVLDVDKDMMNLVCGFKLASNGTQVYHCFGTDSLLVYNKTRINIHENLESSWNCFIEYMFNPTDVVIYYDNSI
jgi:hypothetical protein